jgi:hypothetical protein
MGRIMMTRYAERDFGEFDELGIVLAWAGAHTRFTLVHLEFGSFVARDELLS